MAITQDKAESIALGYSQTEFKNKTQGLLKAGYKRSYALSGLGQRLYGNIRVKKAINKIRQGIAEKQKNSREFVTTEFLYQYAKHKEGKGLTAIRALENLGKNVGWFLEDNAQKQEKTVLDAEQQALYDDYLAYRRRMLLKGTG